MKKSVYDSFFHISEDPAIATTALLSEAEDKELGAVYYLSCLEPLYTGPAAIPLKEGENTVGIDPSCDIVIAQDLKAHTVSRRHACIMLEEGRVSVKDSSKNGTFIAPSGDEKAPLTRLDKGSLCEIPLDSIIVFANLRVRLMLHR